ncbi:MAG: LysM domain-containing protein [Actinomycetota bacterium]|nr:LysM domain-containing protein [Actinomycetota bacterium]
MVAIQDVSTGRQRGPRMLSLVDGSGGRTARRVCRGHGVINVLRSIVIAGTVSIMLLVAYSIGMSSTSRPSTKSLSEISSRTAPYLSYIVKPGDSVWSIASRVAATPAEVPYIAKEITSLEGGAVLQPGTVLNIAY